MKGLKFTPTSKRNVIKVKRDVAKFTRKLRLIEILSSEEKKPENELNTSLAKPRSSCNPPRNRNACLDKTVDFLYPKTFQTFDKYKLNLTKA